MTLIPDEAAEAARRRTDLIAGLGTFIAWLAAHPGSPVPDVYAAFRVEGSDRSEQTESLNEAADYLGVPVTADETGTLIAGRDFGPVRAQAHLDPWDCVRELAEAGMPAFDTMLAAAGHWSEGEAGSAA